MLQWVVCPATLVPCCRPLVEPIQREHSTDSYAEAQTSGGETIHLSTASTVQPLSATSTVLHKTEGSAEDPDEESFQFPWAGEPFWQVKFLQPLRQI